MGTRDPAQTLTGGPVADWHTARLSVRLVRFADAIEGAGMILLALNGEAAVEVVSALRKHLADKIVVDITNAFAIRDGRIELTVCNTDSQGERIQRAAPDARVVKGFSTVNASVQIAPRALADGEHQMFIAGDSDPAKQEVDALMRSYGWKHVIDLGDIRACRAIEMMLPMWLSLMHHTGTASFNYRLVVDR